MSHSKQCLQVHCSRRRQWLQELDGEMILRRPSTRGCSSSGRGHDRYPQRKADRKKWLFSLDRLVEEDVLILDLFFPDGPP